MNPFRALSGCGVVLLLAHLVNFHNWQTVWDHVHTPHALCARARWTPATPPRIDPVNSLVADSSYSTSYFVDPVNSLVADSFKRSMTGTASIVRAPPTGSPANTVDCGVASTQAAIASPSGGCWSARSASAAR